MDICFFLYYNVHQLYCFNVSYYLMKEFNKIFNIKILIFILILILSGILFYKYIKSKKSTHKLHYISSNKQIFSNEFLTLFIREMDNEKIPALDSLDLAVLKQGKKEMTKHKLIITGITRDNIKDFFVMVKNIEYVGKYFKDYQVVIFENDSTDGTKEALKIWQQNNPKVHVISKDYKLTKRPSHQFLANIRNEYIEEISKDKYSDFDMLMVIDMDMSKGVDIRGVWDSFSKISDWDAVCSNGVREETMNGAMYDVFAFRNEEFPWTPEKWHEICSYNYNDLENQFIKLCKSGYELAKNKDYTWMKNTWLEKDKLYWQYIVPQAMKVYKVNSGLVKVDSCFGGMAFYKTNFIKNCYYKSINNDCEHVFFHQCLIEKNNARMFMNPNQMIRYD